VPARLLGNFPNPFNPTTTIAYELSSPAPIHLRVYDVAGRLVRTLEHGTLQTAGRHEVRWDGRDETGRGVASGMYVYRLDDGQARESGRMLLVK
jgi:flagellar hook assembly protein FlgD